MLEDTGLIGQVGAWALRRALADEREWRGQGASIGQVAVNVSPLQLDGQGFAGLVSDVLSANPGITLELEITESVIMKDVEKKIRLLESLRRLGVHVAIDDFGTGYSSLAYISRLPVNTLKIDRAFVTGMTQGIQGYVLVSSIIAMAHALGLRVVAEGVETEEQASLLLDLQCDEAQGYLFSKPMPSDELLRHVLASRR